MRFIFRWAFRLLILLVVGLTALLLLKDAILREVVQGQLRSATGLEVKLDRFELGLLDPTVSLEGLRLYNPPEFGGGVFLDLSELHVDYYRDSLISRRLHLRLARLSLSEMSIVENDSGKSNLEAIAALFKQRQHNAWLDRFTYGGVDTLNLSLGRITHRRLRPPGQAQTIDLNVRGETLIGLRTEADLYLALGRLALKLGVRELTNFFLPHPPVPAQPTSTQPATTGTARR